jgi:hypothetical protein
MLVVVFKERAETQALGGRLPIEPKHRVGIDLQLDVFGF